MDCGRYPSATMSVMRWSLRLCVVPFAFFVLGHLETPIRAIMDNQAAVSFSNPAHLSDFLKRRLEQLLWYSPTISFCPGPFNYLADFLSRQGHGFPTVHMRAP